jgi:uncharacterized DUF497 family protein
LPRGKGVKFILPARVRLFADPLSSTFPDPEHSLAEERFVIFGLSDRGRILAVMYCERRRLDDGTEVIRIISAREATRGERAAYEEGRQ